jgi:hypothetical protein
MAAPCDCWSGVGELHDVYDEDNTFVGHVSVERVDADWFNIGSKCHEVWDAWSCGGDTLSGTFTWHEEGPERSGFVTRGFASRRDAEAALVAEARRHPPEVRVLAAQEALSPAARQAAKSCDEEWFVFEGGVPIGSIVKRAGGWVPGRAERRSRRIYATRDEATEVLRTWWRRRVRENREAAWDEARLFAETAELQYTADRAGDQR